MKNLFAKWAVTLFLPIAILLHGCGTEDNDSTKTSMNEVAASVISASKYSIDGVSEILDSSGDIPTESGKYDANGELANDWLKPEKEPQPSLQQPSSAPILAQSSAVLWLERALWLALCVIGVLATYILNNKQAKGKD